ncbi:MAG TPA: four helix bundle protein [Chitinophagales bacterium]|nr:four helix bundle protein [Chitinophagales bacterium]
MSSLVSYTQLEVWKKARILVCAVYRLTAKFPKEELYGLTSQIRRAAVSIPSNIAEGCGRQYKKETIQFQFIARGSQYELETELYLAFDLGFISEQELNSTLDLLIECRKLISGFINYLESSNLK